ncbi:hypothetical protein BHE74_00016142 [Ensete ventricosum]|nr:hypothetical protein BHE74_00016142 [Ensete ventricosum]
MALKLSSQLPLSLQKSHKGSQRWPMPHPIPPPNLAGCGCSLLPSGVTSLSRRSGGRGVVHAVKEEETLPPALAEADASKTPSSSSKLVLVVGGTGGVDGYRHVSFIRAYGFASIMNLFGVLKFKKMGEDFVRSSGLPFTIIR